MSRKRKTNGQLTTTKWSQADRQRFSDGDRLRALAVPARRRPGPSADEWR